MVNGKCKRGLSPVIASVLMIMLVLILASMIFLWARGFITEQVEKFGKPIGDFCEAVDFRVEKITVASGDELEILNKGNVDIRHLEIKMIKGGDEEVSRFEFQIDAGAAVRERIELKMKDGGEPDETIVYPALIGNVRGSTSNRPFTCVNFGKVI